MQNHTAVNTAQAIILRDLVDALLFEDIAGSNSEITKENGQTLLSIRTRNTTNKDTCLF